MSLKNLVKPLALTVGVLASTMAFSQNKDSKDILLPNPDEAKVTKVDTTYVQDDGKSLVKTVELRVKAKQYFPKDSTSVEEMEKNGLTGAYTDALKKEKEALAKEAEIQKARADSAENFLRKGSFELRGGMNIKPVGDNTYKISPVFGLGYKFHILNLDSNTKLGLGLVGYAGTPKDVSSTTGSEVFIKESVHNAGPYMYVGRFYDQTTITNTVKQLVDLYTSIDFKVKDNKFSVAAGPSVSLATKVTDVKSLKRNYLVATSTGNSIPSSVVDLGTKTSSKSKLNLAFNFAAIYKGKEGSRFGFGVYGSNIGSENAHYGFSTTMDLFKSKNNNSQK
jgi:hypothetical protein